MKTQPLIILTQAEVPFLDGDRTYELAPCPFCGSARVEFNERAMLTSLPPLVFVFCVDCNARGPEAVGRGNHEQYQAAADRWNGVRRQE